jgi:hypothetical protein
VRDSLPYGGEPGSLPGSATFENLTPVGQRPAKPHTLRPPGATPGPATDDRVRKLEKRPGREPGEFVGSTPTSVISVPWSNGTTPARHAGGDGSTPSGINRRTRSVGVAAAHVLGKDEARVQFPDGPLETWAAGPTARHLGRNQKIGVQRPGGPLTTMTKRAHGLTARRQLGRLAIRVRLPVGPLITEGSRIRLAGPRC